MKKLLPILFLFAACSAFGAGVERISLLITITNTPKTSNTLTINATTRYWTNASTLTTILTNLVSTNYSTTNLYNQIASFPYTGPLILQYASSNKIRLIGPVGGALAGSASGGWADLTLSTQSGPQTYTALWPMENMVGETNRTNQGSALVAGLSTFSTNAFATNSTATSNFITKGASPDQFITSPLRVTGTLRATSQLLATNGFTSALTNINPVTSNLVNYGNAIRSEGIGGVSLQVGSNAVSAGLRSVAIGNNAYATNNDSTAIGTSAIATNKGSAFGRAAVAGVASMALGDGADARYQNSIAIGPSTFASGEYGIAIGASEAGSNVVAIGRSASGGGANNVIFGAFTASSSDVTNSVAIGYGASVTHTNAAVFGANAASSGSNQVLLGTSTTWIQSPGIFAGNTHTNTTLKGQTINGGDQSFVSSAITTVANGHNTINVGTNVYVRITGSPSVAWTLGAITGGNRDGKILIVENSTALDMTIQNESGTEPTAANRILTYAGAGGVTNVLVTGSGVAEFIYNGALSRWILRTPSVDVVAVATNSIANFDGSATNLNVYTYEFGSLPNLMLRPSIGRTMDLLAAYNTNFGVAFGLNSNGTPYQVVGASNVFMGGLAFKRITVPAFTNLNTTITTFTNAALWIAPEHILTNNGDSMLVVWRGNCLAGTNNLKAIYGVQTVLDTGPFTNAFSAWELGMEITRTGSSTAHADAWFTFNQVGPALTSFESSGVRTNLEIAPVNGVANTNLLQLASNRAGSISNNYMRVEWQPASR